MTAYSTISSPILDNSTVFSTKNGTSRPFPVPTSPLEISGSNSSISEATPNATFSENVLSSVGVVTPKQGSLVLFYIFLPVIIILAFGGIVLAVKYSRRRAGVKQLRKHLVPFRRYDDDTELEHDENLVEIKLVEPCCNDPLLAFKPSQSTRSLELQNLS